jgi:hypothetical protein
VDLNESRPVIYHLRVRGRLDAKWADWFEGFAMVAREDGSTLLSGPVADQAALHGVLDKLHGLGLELLVVMQTECPCSKGNCPNRACCRACAERHGAKNKLPYCFRPRTRWDKQCSPRV